MAKYKKRPVVIEAEKFDPANKVLPKGVCVGDKDGRCADGKTLGYRMDEFHIHTLEGVMKVSKGDFVIQGVKGEFYSCRADIFEATYDRVILADNGGPVPIPA